MKNSKKGFTVVELVIVIAAIAILAAVLIPTFSAIIKEANDSAAESELRQIKTLIETELADDNSWEFTYGEDKKVQINKNEDGKLWQKYVTSLADALNACPALDAYGSFTQNNSSDLTYKTKSGVGEAVWSDIVGLPVFLQEFWKGIGFTLNEDRVSYSITSTTYVINALADIELPSEYDGMPITRIGDGAFKDANHLKSVVIPEGVEIIDASAFEGCVNLEEATIPSSVKYIGLRAFVGCTSLRKLHYNGTADNWKDLGKRSSSHWYPFKDYDIECTDTTIMHRVSH